MAMYEEYKLGQFVWYKPHLLDVEPMQMKIVGFRDPGPLELGEDAVLYVLRNEDGLVIYDATFQDISKLEEEVEGDKI